MSKYNKKTTAGKVLGVLLALVLIALVGGLIYKLTNGFTTDAKPFALEYEGTLILNDTNGKNLRSGDKFTVKRLTGKTDEYAVKVYAENLGDKDLTFKVSGSEMEYSWNEYVAGQDVTSGFEIEKTGDSFTITGGVMKVLTSFSEGLAVKLTSEVPAADLFRMEVIIGKAKMSVGIYFGRVTGVTVSPGEIVFG